MSARKVSGSSSSGRPKKVNATSDLLTDGENQLLFSLIGPNCVAQATAVVRVYRTMPGNAYQWTKVGVGVAAFIKDSKMKSYFIRIYNLRTHTKFFEEEMYQEFDYKSASWHFHHFTGANAVCGLSFASRSEADVFKAVIDNRIAAREKRKEERRAQRQNENIQPVSNQDNQKTSNEVSNMHIVDVGNRLENGNMSKSKNLSVSSNSVNRTSANSLTSIFKSSGKKSSQKKKELSKTDIGLPTNFRHLEHVGGGQKRTAYGGMAGASAGSSDNYELLCKMIVSHGICSHEDLQTQKTQNIIQQFVSSKGTIEEVMKSLTDQTMLSNDLSSGESCLSPESVNGRHSVHSPSSASPALTAPNQTRFSTQNGSSVFHSTKGPAPVRRPPPPEPTRRESSMGPPPYMRSRGAYLGSSTSSETNISAIPYKPPLPASRPAGFTQISGPEPALTSYDGNYPFAPFRDTERGDSTKKAPPPPLPQGHPQKKAPGIPPKLSPRKSSVEKMMPNDSFQSRRSEPPATFNENKRTAPPVPNPAVIPPSLSRPGSRAAISEPSVDPPASLVKTKTSFIDNTCSTTRTNASRSTSNASNRSASTSITQISEASKHTYSTPNNNVAFESTRQSNGFQNQSRNALPSNGNAPEMSSRSPNESPFSAGTRPTAPPKLSKLNGSPPSSANGQREKQTAPKPPSSEAPKTAPPPPPPPPPSSAPPPPPPQQVSGASTGPSKSKATVVPSQMVKSDDLLSAIRKSSVSQLRPASERLVESPRDSSASVDPKSNLLGEIRNFDRRSVLKKVEPKAASKDTVDQSGKQLPGLLGDLARMLNEQRMTMNPDSAGNSKSGCDSDDDDNSDSFDDDDWD